MERTRLGEAEEVSDLADGERRIGEQAPGGIAPHIVDDLLIRHAFGGQAALKGARRNREVARHGVDVRETAREAGDDDTAYGLDDRLG